MVGVSECSPCDSVWSHGRSPVCSLGHIMPTRLPFEGSSTFDDFGQLAGVLTAFQQRKLSGLYGSLMFINRNVTQSIGTPPRHLISWPISSEKREPRQQERSRKMNMFLTWGQPRNDPLIFFVWIPSCTPGMDGPLDPNVDVHGGLHGTKSADWADQDVSLKTQVGKIWNACHFSELGQKPRLWSRPIYWWTNLMCTSVKNYQGGSVP